MTRRLATLASLALALALALSACGGGAGGSDSDDTVTVLHVPSTLFAPLYVADARGYFEDAGLTVQMETLKAGQDGVPLTASGRADVLVAGFGSGLFSAAHEGLGIKVVGSMGGGGGTESTSPTALMVAAPLVESGEIAQVEDLRGRKVAVSGGPGGAGAYQLAAILAEADMGLTDVEVVNLSFPDMSGALSGGTADAALPPAPFTTAMEQDGVAEQFAIPPEGTIAAGVVYGEDFVESDSAQSFFDALVQAQRDIAENGDSEEILQILVDATGQEIEALSSSPSYVFEDGLAPAVEQLDQQQAAYRDAGLFDFDTPVPVEDMVDATFSEQAASSS